MEKKRVIYYNQDILFKFLEERNINDYTEGKKLFENLFYIQFGKKLKNINNNSIPFDKDELISLAKEYIEYKAKII